MSDWMGNGSTGGAPGMGPEMAPGQGPVQKKFPWAMVLGGCGCLTLVGLVAAGVIGYMAYSKATEIAGEHGETISMFKEIRDSANAVPAQGGEASGGGKAGSAAGEDTSARVAEEKGNATDSAKIRNYLNQPLTAAEVRAFRKAAEQWRKNPAYVKWEKANQNVADQSGREDDSVAGKLRAARNLGQVYGAMGEMAEAFDEHVEKQGGYEAYYGRAIRISGALAATATMAKQHDKPDQHADEVIKLVLEEQPGIAKEFQESLAEARATAKKGGDNNPAALQALMAISAGGPGAAAMARMPAASFRAWQSLSAAERKGAEEDLKTTFGPSTMFGIAINPEALLVGAVMADISELQ